MNARRNGYKIFVDPTVKVLHHKETIYQLPWDSEMQTQADPCVGSAWQGITIVANQ
jgi:hypothetical protein